MGSCRLKFRDSHAKQVSGAKLFVLCESRPWVFRNHLGCFAQNKHKNYIIGGSKSAPWRCGLVERT